MSRPKVFQIPAILEGVNPLKDGGFSLRFHTNELTDKRQQTKLLSFFNTFGWLQFSDKSIGFVPSKAAVRDAGERSPQQRLRAVMYVYWQHFGGEEDFEVWYTKRMEQTINKYKEQLP